MNILITGGAGFIASHIVDRLVGHGHVVSIIDNLSTGNMDELSDFASFYHCSIMDDEIESIFQKVQPEVVFHHAAQIDVQTSLSQPVLDAEINILGTIKLLEQCKKYGVRKIIYASSAAVYGTPEYLPVDERHPVQPLSFYGISKHTPEHYIEVFSKLSDLDYTILRYANVYGIRQDPRGEGGVISIFVNKLLEGRTPIIFGDGEQTRDFIYVKDIVEANIAALEKGSKGIYNISCNEQTTVNQLLKVMSEICNMPFEPQYLPPRSGDIIHSCLDNSAAKEELGWKPKYTLAEGLKETCDYYAKIYNPTQLL
ncbi:NAD-dependent epimerase/dehydratase family protein [Paenibacillus sp. H1-7]|uniref:SDR family oxidoreductase n=1 Tax=Paenibacillus sp. H1-7 TaxID=2282849 RepID=UPI001EF90DC6|nr:SDR family oxidoreductase [Paenibacillus sp. H1-7]ULL19023.1 NAD-dependent epimerase/dehydratase family protein [Paenibacillus sp. H1-7]